MILFSDGVKQLLLFWWVACFPFYVSARCWVSSWPHLTGRWEQPVKNPPKHNKKQRSSDPGVQPSIEPNFRGISPPLSLLVPSDQLNTTLGWWKWGEQGAALRGKMRSIQHPQAVSVGLVQIRMAVLFVSLLLLILLPALCLLMARRMKLWFGRNYGLGVSFQSN